MTKQEIISEIKNIQKFNYTLAPAEFFEEVIDAVGQQKSGIWISRYHISDPPCDTHFWVCSECRQEYSHDAESGIEMNKYDYCPNCGVKMEH